MEREGVKTDETGSGLGAYGNLGMILPAGGMDIVREFHKHLQNTPLQVTMKE